MKLFELGKVVLTVGAQLLLESRPEFVFRLLQRHGEGDWGDMPAEDQASNLVAARKGGRVFGSFNGPEDQKIWIITEAENSLGHREYTTILLPMEY